METDNGSKLTINGTGFTTTEVISAGGSATVSYLNSMPLINSPQFIQAPSYQFVLNHSIPDHAVPLARTIYPDDFASICKLDNRYFINKGDNYYTEQIQMKNASVKDGAKAEHLLAIAEDHLDSFETLSEHQQQALKHIRYAIAFLEKNTLETKSST